MAKIKEWIKEWDFWKHDTGNTVEGFHAFMVSKGISEVEAFDWIESLVCAMKNEYGD